MKLEQQVCSLELAKKLKKLGVKQNSLVYWDSHAIDKIQDGFGITSDGEYSAFTSAELGEMLPYKYDGTFKTKKGWMIGDPLNLDNYFIEPTEADARAKMLIYLLENKLLEIEK